MEELINYIYKNKISTTFCSDALDKHGVIPNCYKLKNRINDNINEIICGQIYPVFVANGSNFSLHYQIREVPENVVCVVFTYNINQISLLGSLVADFLFKTRKIKALVVHGFIRDAYEIESSNYPIWSMGYNPIGCSNNKGPDFPKEEVQRLKDIYDGGIAICDSCGVVAIPRHLVEEKEIMINKLDKIRDRELIWNHCINVLGWDTYETIILKSYLNDKKELIWDDYLEKLVEKYKKEYGNKK